MTISKGQFLDSLYRESPYCVVSGKGFSKELGFITNSDKLISGIAAFAGEHNCRKVKVRWGRNIMNVDQGPIGFSITLSVK